LSLKFLYGLLSVAPFLGGFLFWGIENIYGKKFLFTQRFNTFVKTMAKINIHKQYLTIRELDNLRMDELLEVLPVTTHKGQYFGLMIMPVSVGKWSVCYYNHSSSTLDDRFGTIYHSDPTQALRLMCAFMINYGHKLEIPKHWTDGDSIGKVPRPTQVKFVDWANKKAMDWGVTVSNHSDVIKALLEGCVHGWRFRLFEIGRLNLKIEELRKKCD
jgi:hypothetical protein